MAPKGVMRRKLHLKSIQVLTECEILLNKRGIVHPGGNLAHEIKDLIPAALGTTGEVLAGELSNPDGLVESLMEVGDVVDELLRVSTVPVEGNGVNLSSSLNKLNSNKTTSLLTWQPWQWFKKFCIQTLPSGALVQAGETR